ncbi:MAG TPA: hypothetical protein OIL90_03210 [Phascolarctobacterium faecium]|uniref:hypothetical protein n=1 Tax=Phascolarctobacterium faecium TaxID=33025 RepID=UPI00242BCC91|nr:hypothetical protein [Phascolarctobacterium faecium]HJI09119.1 hypothetical protein [Phascolarctobacterium faecium]
MYYTPENYQLQDHQTNFLKSEQKCLAGGDRYDNIMSNIKTASKRYRIAKLLVGFYKQVASFVRFFVTKEA